MGSVLTDELNDILSIVYIVHDVLHFPYFYRCFSENMPCKDTDENIINIRNGKIDSRSVGAYCFAQMIFPVVRGDPESVRKTEAKDTVVI